MTVKNIYEIGFLINPDLSQQEAEQTVENLKKILEKQGAAVISEGEVVDIDLAYQIITKIASKNERFDQAFFSWVKFETDGEKIADIKKEVDKIKKEIFRYLISKTVADDEATNKYKNTSENKEGGVENKEESDDQEKVDAEIIDTTTEDDLTKIEGIGPVIAETLINNNIKTFAELAEKSPEEISEIITDVAGGHDPETWPKQAELAAKGEWEELEKWQAKLIGGKE